MNVARPAALMLLGILFVPLTSAAQESVRFNRLTVEDGLSQDSVNAIVQDHEGFIWFGTQQGLNRYDGFEFTTFLHDPNDPDSLPSDWIWALQVDRSGRLWVGTDTGGLARFDPSIAIFQRYPIDPDSDLRNASVRSIVEDAEGYIWIGTDGAGLSRLDPSTGQLQRYLSNESSLSSDRIKALHVDGFGVLWVGTDGGGLSRYDSVTQRFGQIDALDPKARIRSLTGGGEDALVIATYEKGLYRFFPTTGAIEHYVHDASDSTSLNSDAVRVLFTDQDGHLWVGHDAHGLNRYEADGGFLGLRHQPANLHGLVDDHISALYQDAGGVIWVGTQAGVSRWNPALSVFSNYVRRDDGPDQLSNNWVAGFAEHDASTVWVATHGGGINRVDLTTNHIDVFNASDPKGLNDDRVLAIVEDVSGDVWAGTRAAGLNRLNPATGIWRHYRHDPEQPTSLSFDGVTSLLHDTAGQLWVGTYLGGLNRYMPEIEGFHHFRHDAKDPGSLCMDRVLSLFEDRERHLWIGTHGGGLCRFDTDTETFTRFNHDASDATSLSSDIAWNVAEDAAGNLWVGTADAGVNVWRAEDRRVGRVYFTRFLVADGLVSPVVYGLLADARGRVWIGSNRGITRVAVRPNPNGSLKLDDVRHFSTSDGLPGNEFNFGAALRGNRGQMFFGSTTGFTTFNPEKIRQNSHAPNVVLTRFSKLNEAVPFVATRGGIELDRFDNLITFEYAAMDFTAPNDNQYQHQLEGFDEAWVDDGNRHRVSYTNLRAGNYTFRARASNNDGVWSDREIAIPVSVAPALWATNSAYAAYTLALIMFAYFVYRARNRRLAVARHIESVNTSLVAEVAERKLKERALDQERQTAQSYLDVVEVIILALDAQGIVTMVNQKGVRVLGIPEEDLLGADFCSDFVPPDERTKVREGLANIDSYAYSESCLLAQDNTERLIAWHTIRLPDSDDQKGGVLMSGTDVTQMRNLQGQLHDAQKMEALGTLARGIAHDFNNILSAILGYTELSLIELDKQHPAHGYLNKLGSSVERAREIIQGILTFGRVTNVRPKPVDLTHVVREALQLVRPIVPNQVQLKEVLESDCGSVMADPSQLIQIVLNLCTNACQSMADTGGVLEVTVDHHEVTTEESRSGPVLQPGLHAKLVIADTGPGMDEYTQSRIFEPFFTTRPQGEGTGLGLSIVHGIVSQLKGSIQLYSEVGAGTRFEIYLPCRAAFKVAYVEDDDNIDDDMHGQETILFVDDEVEVVEIAETSLARLGYRVLTASNGADALSLFSAGEHDIDILITDQTMPGLSGDQVAAQAKAQHPHLPVLMVSGADQLQGDHVDEFLGKPYTQQELVSKIRNLLTRLSA